MYSIKDIVKKSFIEGYSAQDISFKTVLLAIVITAAISLYIFMLYRIITRKTFYSKNFNISLVGVSLITAAVIITIQSSIVVSLGMVGALSIVRFRTAIKDPMDLMFLFWSISTGIICGAGFAEYALILAAVLTLIILILENVPVTKTPMILIINMESTGKEDVLIDVIKEYSTTFKVKARNMTSTTIDFTVEVRTKSSKELANNVMKVEGVVAASLLEHSGEITF